MTLAAALADLGSDEAVVAWLLAARAAARTEPAAEPEHLARAVAYRAHPGALVRSLAWQASCLVSTAGG